MFPLVHLSKKCLLVVYLSKKCFLRVHLFEMGAHFMLYDNALSEIRIGNATIENRINGIEKSIGPEKSAPASNAPTSSEPSSSALTSLTSPTRVSATIPDVPPVPTSYVTVVRHSYLKALSV